jgi:hypothetical protein
MKSVVSLAALAAVCLGSVSPALALNHNQENLAAEFAINNTTWVLYHEVGHMFVDQFQLPVLGAREEDAADALATLMLLSQQTEDATRALRDSVDGWMMSDAWYNQGSYDKYDFYDPHSIDIVRAYAIACLAVGADYNGFVELAGEIGLEGDRASTCVYDYELASRSWAETLEPHRTGAKRNDTPIEIVYERSSRELAGVAQLIQQEGLLEEIAATVTENYSLQRGVTFRALECGQENAFYDGSINEVQICYEYVKLFYDLKADELRRTGEGLNDVPNNDVPSNDGNDGGKDKNGGFVGVPHDPKTKDKF